MGRHRPAGAYGLTFHGLPDSLLVPVPPETHWPGIRVSTEVCSGQRDEYVSPDSALLPLVGGSWASLDRQGSRATLLTDRPEDGALLHPFLATAAVIFSWWHGRHAFHGGAFLGSAGHAWALAAERGAGKSSTLAALARNGTTVVADDLLVVDQGLVFAGPRIIDLRPDAALELALDGVHTVREGARRRLVLGPTPAQSPLAGWIFLSWGPAVSMRRLSPMEWLERATSHLNTVTSGSPSILHLAGGEAWELTRPRALDSLEATVEELRALTAG